jgi:hypothetical protein
MEYFQKFIKLPANEKLLFCEALFFLFLAKGMLVVLPFRLCLGTIRTGRNIKNPAHKKPEPVKLAISRASRLASWKNICLVQSFAARWMLQRRKISSTLSIGVGHNQNNNLTAHAWLTVEGFEIVPHGGYYITLTTW